MSNDSITLLGVTRAAQDGIGRKQVQIESIGASQEQADGSRSFTVRARDGGIYVVNISTFKEPTQ